jgi:hypothetical protein
MNRQVFVWLLVTAYLAVVASCKNSNDMEAPAPCNTSPDSSAPSADAATADALDPEGGEVGALGTAIDPNAVATATGGTPQVTGHIVKVSFPRADMPITIDNWSGMPPFMGLTSYAAFTPTVGMGSHVAVMGDLVLLEDEVNPTMSAALDAVFGVTGTAQAGMYKAAFPRTITSEMCGGCTLSGSEAAAMGIYTWAAFGGTNDAAAVDGDFAATEAELQPVLKALRAGGINIVSIHHHMMGDSPRLIFLHYWGRAAAAQLAMTIKSAVDLTAWDGRH